MLPQASGLKCVGQLARIYIYIYTLHKDRCRNWGGDMEGDRNRDQWEK
jgi:hypothetical protein